MLSHMQILAPNPLFSVFNWSIRGSQKVCVWRSVKGIYLLMKGREQAISKTKVEWWNAGSGKAQARKSAGVWWNPVDKGKANPKIKTYEKLYGSLLPCYRNKKKIQLHV